jgi:hypothetical protein
MHPSPGSWQVSLRQWCALIASLLVGCSSGPSPDPAPPDAFPSVVLNSHDPAARHSGFTVVDATPSELHGLPLDQPALIWLGGYDNATCSLSTNDAEVRRHFADHSLATDSRVYGYYLADEPNADGSCPSASTQVRQRAVLIRYLDPNPRHITLANIDDPRLFAAFRDSVDVLATDPYPCPTDGACDWSLIPSRIAQLRAAGVVRYMGMLQAFSGGNWRWPTADELERMIGQWRRSDWCGAITFSWSYRGARLADHPELLAVLQRFNADLPTPAEPCFGP